MYSCECLQVRAWHSILRVIEVFNVHMTIGLSLVVAGVSWYLSSRVPSGFFKRRKGDNQLGPLWRFFSFEKSCHRSHTKLARPAGVARENWTTSKLLETSTKLLWGPLYILTQSCISPEYYVKYRIMLYITWLCVFRVGWYICYRMHCTTLRCWKTQAIFSHPGGRLAGTT